MKLALGLLMWFVTTHVAMMVGIVAFVAIAVAVGVFWPEAQ